MTSTQHEREELRAALKNALQVLDLAAGEGLHYQAAGEIWDAGDAVFELAEALGADIANESDVPGLIVSRLLASLSAPDTAGEVVAYLYATREYGKLASYGFEFAQNRRAECGDRTTETPLYATPQPAPATGGKFKLGDRVTKTKGSKWTGRVVGFYSTTLTAIGYAVESETETGSVQIYPEAALAALNPTAAEGGES